MERIRWPGVTIGRATIGTWEEAPLIRARNEPGKKQIGSGAGEGECPLRRAFIGVLRHLRAGVGKEAANRQQQDAPHRQTMPRRGHRARRLTAQNRAEEQKPQRHAAPGGGAGEIGGKNAEEQEQEKEIVNAQMHSKPASQRQ